MLQWQLFLKAPDSLKERVDSRYVFGDKFRISNAQEVVVKQEADKKKNNKKSFGGSGRPSGRLKRRHQKREALQVGHRNSTST